MQLSHAFQPSTTVRHWSPALICSMTIATSGRASLGGSDDRGGTGGAAGHPTISTAGGVGRSTASNCGTRILPTVLQPVVSVSKRARHDVVLIERRTVDPPVLIGGGDAVIVERSRYGDGDLLGTEVLALENIERFLAPVGGVDRYGGVSVRQGCARLGRVPVRPNNWCGRWAITPPLDDSSAAARPAAGLARHGEQILRDLGRGLDAPQLDLVDVMEP